MARFEDLGLAPKALEAVRVLGYTQPTPVQEQTIPLVVDGRDVIAGAQTGTGKTAAFCLPCLGGLRHAAKHCGPLMLIVTPTRELADQIGEVCLTVAGCTKHRVTTVVGGVSYNPQKEALKRGTDVLIATPGRLEDLLAQQAVGLDQVEVLVLDEADRMVDMGFLPSVRRIVAACTAPHQTLLFSATIDDAVEEFAQGALINPARVDIAHRGDTAQTVDQYIVRISHAAKPSALKAILEEHGANRVIVFARTRHRVDTCVRRLNRNGYVAAPLHSDKSQNQRRRALEDFHAGKVHVLVATDVLSRGIDISQVDYVVNYDLPMQPEDYIHRIGRTGRAGESGFSISLVSPETEDALRDIQQLIHQEIPEMRLTTLDVAMVEAEAETRSLQLQARREKDPEVEAVILEMAAKERKKRKKTRKSAKSADKKAESESITVPEIEKPQAPQGAGAQQKRSRSQRKAKQGLAAAEGAVSDQADCATGEQRLTLDISSPEKGRKRKAKRGGSAKDAAQKGEKASAANAVSATRSKAQSRAKAGAAKQSRTLQASEKKRGGADMRPGRARRAEIARSRAHKR